VTIDDSVIQGTCPGGATCSNIRTGSPALGPLQLNGGFTKTMALGAGSAAIDAGNGGTCDPHDQRDVSRSQGLACDAGAYEVRAMPFTSSAANDGRLVESAENSNIGGAKNVLDQILWVGDDDFDRQFRSIVSFNTAAISDTAPIVMAKLALHLQSVDGTDPFTTHGALRIDVANPFFGAGVGLDKSDFEAAPTVSAAGRVLPPPSGDLYSGVLNLAGRAAINRSGSTQLRLRFALDDNDDQSADVANFYSGDATNPASRPVLWLYYNP
jgi:hypothetical protein